MAHDVLHMLLLPDADHHAVGLSANAAAGTGVGVGAVTGANLDFVFDYRHDQIGVFFSPFMQAGLSAGTQEYAGVSGELGTGGLERFQPTL